MAITVQQIIDYVRETPENTNINVLKGMMEELREGPIEYAVCPIFAWAGSNIQVGSITGILGEKLGASLIRFGIQGFDNSYMIVHRTGGPDEIRISCPNASGYLVYGVLCDAVNHEPISPEMVFSAGKKYWFDGNLE